MFNKIDFSTYPRAEHYNYYINFIKSKINMSYNINITNLLEKTKSNSLKFYPTFIYVIMRAINDIKEMRMAVDKDGNLGYYDYCNPSYTIFHKDDKTFSDIWTPYSRDFKEFYSNAVNDMEKYKDVKGVKAKPDKPDNFIPLSCVPWLSFSACSYDTYSPSPMLFPVIVFGKYFKQNNETFLPFTIFATHAVCDGYHVCLLINTIEELCQNCDEFIK